MLTLNSNILKIGNKWLLPVESGGVVPPVPPEYDEYWLNVTVSSSHKPVWVNHGLINGHFGGNALAGIYYNPDTGEGTLTGNNLAFGSTAPGLYAGYSDAQYITIQLDVTEALTSLSFYVYVEASATITLVGRDSSGTLYQLARSTIEMGSGSYVYQNVSMDLSGTVYNITCTDDGNGTLSSDIGGGITDSLAGLTATPDTGYSFDSYTLVSGTGASISGDILRIGTSDVTIRANFIAQAPASYNYFLLELTGYDTSTYWRGGSGGYYGVKSFKFNGSSVTSSNCMAGYISQNLDTWASVNTYNIEGLANTGDYNSSPYYWGERYDSSYYNMYKRTYILVGTGAAITSGTISFQDLLQNSNVPSTGGITITSNLYGVPSSAVRSSSYGTMVNISACTLLNTGTHTAKYAPFYGSSVTLNTTTISYGV